MVRNPLVRKSRLNCLSTFFTNDEFNSPVLWAFSKGFIWLFCLIIVIKQSILIGRWNHGRAGLSWNAAGAKLLHVANISVSLSTARWHMFICREFPTLRLLSFSLELKMSVGSKLAFWFIRRSETDWKSGNLIVNHSSYTIWINYKDTTLYFTSHVQRHSSTALCVEVMPTRGRNSSSS